MGIVAAVLTTLRRVKVLSVVGNRPQFIKSAPLSLALRGAEIDEVVLHTGQHYDRELSEVFFEELGLAEPAYALGLRTADPAAMEPAIAHAIEREQPDWTIVFGDTNSTLAGARASVELGVPVAHVEAGLRSGDWSMPEERNRVEVDRIGALLLCPDERSAEILRGEEVPGAIDVVGDVMYDACLTLLPIARERSHALDRFGVEPGRFVLVTIHREANVQPERLRRIVSGLNRVEERIVFPAHPRTRSVIAGIQPRRLDLGDPLGSLDLAALA